METDKKTIAKLLDMPEDKLEIDRCSYTLEFPDEIKAWKFIGKTDPALRRYQNKLYYPPSALINLMDTATELLFRNRFNGLGGLPALVANDSRFRKPVMPENELLIQVKLLRNYKGKIGIFSGVIADLEGDIVAENISKGTIIRISSSPNTSRARILVVDDEEYLIDLLREILEAAGYEVTALTSSIAAFRLFSEAPSRFDLVIADEKMPELSGTDLSEQMLEIRPDIPIILYTDYPGAASVKRAQTIATMTIVSKSINMNRLIADVRRLLER
jgi:CheY-like chemotaxis protein/3-hydroxymyristoyl/3-hydroxydecanoyl-(acyl carrier protein) dehydratase